MQCVLKLHPGGAPFWFFFPPGVKPTMFPTALPSSLHSQAMAVSWRTNVVTDANKCRGDWCNRRGSQNCENGPRCQKHCLELGGCNAVAAHQLSTDSMLVSIVFVSPVGSLKPGKKTGKKPDPDRPRPKI